MSDGPLIPWEILSEEELLVREPWLRVAVHAVRLPDGREVPDYYQVGIREYALVFAQTADQKVLVLQQYKHGAGRVAFGMPAGFIEEGEKPLACAQRELLEETGYTSESWTALGRFVADGNHGCGWANLFRADNARQVAEPNSGDLETARLLLMDPAELIAAVKRGEVASLCTVAAIAMGTHPRMGHRGTS